MYFPHFSQQPLHCPPTLPPTSSKKETAQNFPVSATVVEPGLHLRMSYYNIGLFYVEAVKPIEANEQAGSTIACLLFRHDQI